MSGAPAGDLKDHVKITIATITIINPIIVNPIWAALADESVDELVLSIKVGGAAILLKPWIEG